MLINIDTKVLTKYRISINQFVILFLVYTEDLKLLEHLVDYRSENIINEVKELINRNFITYKSELNDQMINVCNIELKPQALQIFATNDCFDELLGLFPTVVTRTDGTKDYLKLDLNRTRKAYSKLIGKNRAKHDQIMDCLVLEIQDKTRTGKMGYFTRLPKWVASEGWSAYEHCLNDDTETNTVKYGEQLE